MDLLDPLSYPSICFSHISRINMPIAVPAITATLFVVTVVVVVVVVVVEAVPVVVAVL